MKHYNLSLSRLLPVVGLALLSFTSSCDDEAVQLGGSLTEGQVAIEVDSLFTVTGRTVYSPQFDSRSISNLIGRIDIEQYGTLNCSFVSQMMPAGAIAIPDSIPISQVDSMKLFIRAPRNSVTGDSLAPQQLTVYQLTKRLPSDINNNFDPEGYYDASAPLGVRNFSMSALGSNDSIYKKSSSIDIQVKMPLELCRKFVNEYRTNPGVFQWPSTFANYFPGIYVKPTFGRGCVENVAGVDMVAYYSYRIKRNVKDPDTEEYVEKVVLMRDSSILMSVAPEALNSNNVTYTPSSYIKQLVEKGKHIIVSPGGYNVEIDFPINEVVSRFRQDKYNLAVVNNLTFEIPAVRVKNDFDIATAPFLLMVRSDKVEEFFLKNIMPDNKTSFWASYNSNTSSYSFTSMREYLLDALQQDEVAKENYTFTLVPVYLTTEDQYNANYETVSIVTTCTQYIYRPTMTQLDLENAKVKFTYSKQQL